MFDYIYGILSEFHSDEKILEISTRVAISVGIIFVAFIADFISKKIIHSVVGKFVYKTKVTWDNIIYEKGVLSRLAHIVPAMIIYYSVHLLRFSEVITDLVTRMCTAYIIAVLILLFHSLFDVIDTIYRQFTISKQRPIKGYLQVAKIFVTAIALILIITTLLNKSPLGFITGLGAMSAILMLVFKDSIMGLVASVQLSANNLVQIGDWIEMPKYGADGDVIDITLQTIRVRNWDMTITSIPIYALIADSFKNWRGMSESRGRRIMRSINIDLNTVRFLNDEDVQKLSQFRLLEDYLEQKKQEGVCFNKVLDEEEKSGCVNHRRLTNIGTFRYYIEAYIRQNSDIRKDMIFLIRQLQPTEKGLPIQIYVFSSQYQWVAYEKVQADIFDHLFAVVPFFGLRIFQEPSGYDFREMITGLQK